MSNFTSSTDLIQRIAVSEKGAANGIATLDGTGKIPTSQIPTTSDEVQEFANVAAFPVTGVVSIIYVALDTSKIYRWGGTVYTEVSPSAVTTVNSQSGTVILTKSDIGLANVDNTSDANKPISTATQTALNAKEATVTATTTADYYRGDKTFQPLNKAAVGLSNVDNTSDVNKPISTATQTALDAKEGTITAGTTSQYYRGDKSFQTLDKTAVGLANVDNTSDANKPISTATQTALNLKADLASPTFTGVPAAPTATAGTSTTQLATTAFVGTAITNAATPDATTLVKGKIQLAGDLAGTAAAPTVPGLATKEPTITATTTADYYRGDKTFQPLNKSAVGLENVDNTSDANKPISTATQTALNGKEATITAATSADYYRGDKTFQPLNKAAVGLSNVDNTSDVNKPISTAVQTALNAKEATITATTTADYYRGDKTFQPLNKAAVGLSNVDNTSDANKPVSTATQTALNLKADLASPTLTGVPAAPTAAPGTNTTQLATTAFVQAAVTGGGVPDASTIVKGIIQLAGDLAGTATSPTVPGLATKEPTITAGTTAQYWRGDKTFQTLDKTAVGLGNVDNTSDANKPISTATQTALNGKEATITATTSADYYRGDKTFQPLNKTAVGLANVDNTSDVTKNSAAVTLTNKSLSDSTTAIVDVTDATKQIKFDAAGTTSTSTTILSSQTANRVVTIPDATTTLVGTDVTQTLTNKTLTAPAITSPTGLVKADVGLANVDNTSDASKPISTATQTALNAKEGTITAGTTSQYWRGDKTFQTLDKTAVGLANVPNVDATARASHTGTQIASTISDFSTTARGLLSGTAPVTYNSTTGAIGASVMTGASGIANGATGTVPAPVIGDQTKFLRGDGTWQTVVGGGGGGGTTVYTGIGLANFGTGDTYTTITITDSNILSTYTISLQVERHASDGTFEDVLLDQVQARVGVVTAGVGFTVGVHAPNSTTGRYYIKYLMVQA